MDFFIVKVTKRAIIEFVNNAKKRIIFIKPAFYEWEIDLILEMHKSNDDLFCEIFTERGDEAIRIGFGDPIALMKISENQSVLRPQLYDKIRMAIVIVDHQTLIYAPDIRFLDSENQEFDFPNGLTGGSEFTQSITEHFPNIKFEIGLANIVSILSIFMLPFLTNHSFVTLTTE